MGRIVAAPSIRYALASRLFPPLYRRDLKWNSPLTSASQRVMLENGLIDHAGGFGLFHLMPLAVRALEKLSRIICGEMDAIGAHKVRMPSLCEKRLFEKTGRLEAFGHDLFQLRDRQGEEYYLAPTHEESMAQTVANRILELSASNAPILLYQITSKFRDEMKPRFGLLRCREFIMKDLYSFDTDESEAKRTYEMCLDAYQRIFQIRLAPLKRPIMRVLSDVGAMGGTISHEFHFQSDCGEDEIDYCTKCEDGVNRELLSIGNTTAPSVCSKCQSPMKTIRTVEVAHAFLLGTKYSEAFDTCFHTPNGRKIAYMGSYGIGVSRLLAALIECNLNQRNQLRWPLVIAPFLLCFIPPKAGSKEETAGATKFAMDVLEALSKVEYFKGEILVDDRTDLTVGRRLIDAKLMGYPFIVVANKSVVNQDVPKFEFLDLTREDEREEMELVTHQELFDRIRQSKIRFGSV